MGDIREFSSGTLKLPPSLTLMESDAISGLKIGTKLYRDPNGWNTYRLVDRNGIQIPFSRTRRCYVEARLADGIAYATSEGIDISPLPAIPEIEINHFLRNPRNQSILISANSADVWSFIGSIELFHESSIWSQNSNTVTLFSDKKHTGNARRFKLPTNVRIHGSSDFEIIFRLIDGREWFRKSELKPFAIETELEGLLNFLKLFQVIKDSDVHVLRQLLGYLYRKRFWVISLLVIFLIQFVANLPFAGPLLTSLCSRIVYDSAIYVFNFFEMILLNIVLFLNSIRGTS